MTQHFTLTPYAGLGETGYRAKFVGRDDEQGRSLEEIARAAAEHSMLPADAILHGFMCLMNEAIKNAQETGQIQHLGPYGALMLNIRGSFDGIDDVYDPARHALAFKLVNGTALKDVQPGFELQNTVQQSTVVFGSIAPMGAEPASKPKGRHKNRYAVRGYPMLVVASNVKTTSSDTVAWEALTPEKEPVGGPMTVLEQDACHWTLAWPSDVPAELKSNELTLVFTLHGGRSDGTPVTKRLKLGVYPARTTK